MVVLMKRLLKNLFYLFFPLLIGTISSYFSGNIRIIYESLNKPEISPRAWVFPVVWTILFLLMGISYYLINRKSEGYDISNVSFWYYFQLIINFFWPIFFFRNMDFTFAFFWILFLIFSVIVTYIKFYKINKFSAYFLIPYIIWIIFAGYLNLSTAILN